MGKTKIKRTDSYNLCKLGRDYSYFVYRTNKLNYRWKKKLVRDIFRMWYKTSNKDGVYNEDYWKELFNDNTKVRSFLMKQFKALTPMQQIKMLDVLFEHKRINENLPK
jgi:hypothetical protein